MLNVYDLNLNLDLDSSRILLKCLFNGKERNECNKMDTIVKNVNPKVCQLCCSRNKATPMYMNLDEKKLSCHNICENT